MQLVSVATANMPIENLQCEMEISYAAIYFFTDLYLHLKSGTTTDDHHYESLVNNSENMAIKESIITFPCIYHRNLCSD